ncbi:MAG: hypothetical protein AVDCRST_MAG66-507, partial [uncultured Pseudonocardia sp.]
GGRRARRHRHRRRRRGGGRRPDPLRAHRRPGQQRGA